MAPGGGLIECRQADERRLWNRYQPGARPQTDGWPPPPLLVTDLPLATRYRYRRYRFATHRHRPSPSHLRHSPASVLPITNSLHPSRRPIHFQPLRPDPRLFGGWIVDAAGVFAPAVAYPTVAEGKARLRAMVSAAHKREHLLKAADILVEVAKPLGIV